MRTVLNTPAAIESTPAARKRVWAGRATYALFLLLFVEGTFQLFYRATTGSWLFTRAAQRIYVDEPFGGWAVMPNLTYRQSTPEFAIDIFTNSQGFRTSSQRTEFSRGRDDGRYRILLLGPSFAFGWGVDYEQTFAAQLEDMLARAGFADGRTIEVINRGVPALPAANNLAWFRNVGKDYAPDLVIQFIYGSMEVNLTAEASRVRDGYLITHDPTLPQRAVALAKNSAIVFYGWTLANRVRGALAPARPGGRIEGAGRVMNAPQDFDPAAPAVAASIDFYDALRETVEAAGARLLVVYFPLSYVVHPGHMDRWRHLGVQDVERQVEFDRRFADFLNERNVTCLNVTQRLIDEARGSPEPLYYWLDVHWTPAGNRAVARAVADWLIANPERARRGANP